MTDIINFKEWAGSLNNGQYIAQKPKEKISQFIDEKEVQDYNNDGYNIYLPANIFRNNTIRKKNMVWQFRFNSQKEKGSIKGDINTRKFWMSQFKDNKQTKETFKKALGRSRGWYKQIAVVIAGLDVYVVLCLDERELQYLRNEVYKNFYEKVYKDLWLVLQNVELKKVKCKDCLSVLIPVPGTFNIEDWDADEVVDVKEPRNLLTKKRFIKMLRAKDSSGYKDITNWGDNIKVNVSKLFNKAADRKKSLNMQENIKKRNQNFLETYKKQYLLNGKIWWQRFLTSAANRFFNMKGHLFENNNYWLKNTDWLRFEVLEDQINNRTAIVVKNISQDIRFELTGLLFTPNGIRDNITKELITYKTLLKDYVLGQEFAKQTGFNRSWFLKYWNNNPNIMYNMFNFWLRDCLGVSLKSKPSEEKETTANNYHIENNAGQNTQLFKEKKDQGIKELDELATSDTWGNFIELYRGGQFAQEDFFKKAWINKDNIIKQGWMWGNIIFAINDLFNTVWEKEASRKTKASIIKKFEGIWMFHKRKDEKDWTTVTSVKLLDHIVIGNSTYIMKAVKNGQVNAPIKKDWFKNYHHNTKFACIKMSDELHKETDEWALAAVNNIDKKFLSELSKNAQRLSLIIMLALKNRKASSQARKNHCLSNQIEIKLGFLTSKMSCSNKTIRRSLDELKNAGKITNWSRINRNNDNKVSKVSLTPKVY